jgi:spermidine synthase
MRGQRRALEVAFTLTGFAALSLQIVWQRVMSVHAGVDLASSTTVVAAFMAGLGLGSLLGGAWADRISPRGAVLTYGLANLGIAAYAAVSLALLYDGYRAVVQHFDGQLASFAFHFVLLVVPTTLMGFSLPLLARGVVQSSAELPRLVGRLYALNTFGAALGAAVTTWLMIGNLGFRGTTWVSAAVEALAALVVLVAFRKVEVALPTGNPVPSAPAPTTPPSGGAWRWYAIFATTGAVALGLELVYFRVVDAIMRSNSYTFGHVLMLYLVLYAAGAAWASRRADKVASPLRAFLWAQLLLSVFTLAGLVFLVNVPEVFGMRDLITRYFATDGYLAGPQMPHDAKSATKLLFAHVTGPLIVMGVPVFLMGASFPFMLAAARGDEGKVGQRVGALQFANIVGNVGGSVITGFWLFDALGTMGTVRALTIVLGLAGVALVIFTAGRQRLVALATLTALLVLGVASPGNTTFWAFLHAAPGDRFTLAEERACVNAWVRQDSGEEVLFINATSQNGWPFDDFHVVIGLLPSLLQEKPQRALAIGLGAGSTAWGLLQDARLEQVRCVELCGGQVTLLHELKTRGAREPTQLLAEPRMRIDVGDGRKALLRTQERWDIITVDALRPNSAYSGSVYSVEFYRLVSERLSSTGLFTQWVPTGRVVTGAASVFPYVSVIEVPGGRGQFLIAGNAPFQFDRARLLERVDAIQGLLPAQHASIRTLFEKGQVQVLREGTVLVPRAEDVNVDLFPRDEYFLNDG